MTVERIGVPMNSSGTTDGVARAPATLRAAGLGGHPTVVDGGDIPVDPPSTTRGPDGVIDGPNLARTLRRVVGVEAQRPAASDHHVEQAVPRQIHQLRLPCREGGVRSARDAFDRGELDGARADGAEVPLVVPGAGLLGQHAGDALAMEIDPPVRRAVHTAG